MKGLVGKVNCRGESVLFVACERGKVEVVKVLIGFQWLLVHELDAFICSIHVAVAVAVAGHTEILKEILKVRPEFARKYTSEGYSPLHLACSKGHVDTIRELLWFESDLLYLRDQKSLESVDMVTNHGETILHLAVKYNQYDGLKYMVEALNILELMNKQDNDGNTVLRIATARKLTTVFF
ncbi:hypothetical protein L1987_61274 [Smallanthus sonchifolius]|uniref:Uncharacterized protein n=1 Tax=Smallanthus sonchifolius TaxID=185202 RepID=A0ACB9DAD5_9ASTR|nr:hypothetical protein L1987_61274 [Smallanthus sonchifolius]